MYKPFSPACENNAEPILAVIFRYFQSGDFILEVGSGTGQHAVYFAEHLPQIVWQTSDRQENHAGINLWIDDYNGNNIQRPLDLDVTQAWPKQSYDGVFSANTTHIMPWSANPYFFAGVAQVLKPEGYFCLYGPFNQNDEYTSESNRQFDALLKSQDSLMGLRNKQAVDELAENNGLVSVATHTMPANNLLLVWRKK